MVAVPSLQGTELLESVLGMPGAFDLVLRLLSPECHPGFHQAGPVATIPGGSS